jgi:integrase
MADRNLFHVSHESILALVADPERDRIFYDDEDKGFGVRITKAGVKSFVQSYYINGVQRRFTIEQCGRITVTEARKRAGIIHANAKDGKDPLREKEEQTSAERGQKRVKELAEIYLKEWAAKRKKPKSVREDKRMINRHVIPKLGRKTVTEIDKPDIEKLHSDMKKTPYQANRVLALLSTMFNFAIDRKWRKGCDPQNPCKGIKRFDEEDHIVWLEPDELHALEDALDEYSDPSAANALRLLMLTGARPSEVLSAPWSQLNMKRAIWTKPSAHTKQKKTHKPPLSDAAMIILRKMQKEASGPYLFPGKEKDGEQQARTTVKNAWNMVCRKAGLSEQYFEMGKRGKPLPRWRARYRIYDLRHTYASHLVNQKVSWPLIGGLLGHTRPETTMKYAHVFEETMREATNDFTNVLKKPQQGAA